MTAPSWLVDAVFYLCPYVAEREAETEREGERAGSLGTPLIGILTPSGLHPRGFT